MTTAMQRTIDVSEYGSFKDSLRAPIHRWFTYPAGYSYKFVNAKIREYGLTGDSLIGDPFLGTGTTSLAARSMGVNSIGVEAHSFVCWVARTKLFLDYDLACLKDTIEEVIRQAHVLTGEVAWDKVWPPLVYKCFTEGNLKKLAALRHVIDTKDGDPHEMAFLRLALTSTLRLATTAGAGWPYIAPSKYQSRKVSRDAIREFQSQCNMMWSDVQSVKGVGTPEVAYKVLNGDAREFDSHTGREAVDLVLTSPPYLNNYDYADRTRLETYFWGIHASWGEITRTVRNHLVTAATTQVSMSSMNGTRECPGIKEVDRGVHSELVAIIDKLAAMRSIKKGKKTYDYVVAGYFEDMLQVIKSVWCSLIPGGHFVLVIGDSAPYGIHIPTEEVLGRLAVAVGFTSFELQTLRSRGGKWAHNSQRHKVPLRESILTITK